MGQLELDSSHLDCSLNLRCPKVAKGLLKRVANLHLHLELKDKLYQMDKYLDETTEEELTRRLNVLKDNP